MSEFPQQGVEGDRVPKRTFFYYVEYDDRNKPGERIGECVAIDGEDEFKAKVRATVGTTSRAGRRLYGGNSAPFSNVSATLLTGGELMWEDPSQRTDEGRPLTIRELCLNNRLV